MLRRAAHRSAQDADERGFTLLEVVVALAILGVILTPLTMAFISMLQRQRDVNDQLSRSADAQRIGAAWTKDVQSVNRDGINVTGTCGASSTGSEAETQLITFSWDTDVSATVPKKTSSWVVVGTDADMKLVRRYCENDIPVQETRLADRIGLDGAAPSAVVHGPNAAQPRNFCPPVNGVSDKCTIVVEGSFSYRLAVARRVPDRSGVVTPDTAPPPPTITGGTVARNTYVTVVWTPPPSWTPPIDRFRALAYTSPTGGSVTSVEVDSLSDAADLVGLTNGTPYWVRVQSHNAVGWGELSPAFGPLTPAPTAPDAPTITSVTPGDTTADVAWTAPGNNGGSSITGWRVWATGGGNTVGPVSFAAGASSGTVPGLTNGTEYRFTVAAVNAMGEGIHSASSDPYVPFGVPGRALITGVNPNPDGSIEVAWQSPADASPPTLPANSSTPDGGRPILGYRVRIATGGAGGPWPSASTSDRLPATATTFTTPPLTLGTSYTFVVETWNARGKSDSVASGPALSATPPNVPISITATQSGVGQVTVTWSAPSANGSPITGYSVRAVGAGSPPVQNVGPSTFQAVYNGLTSGSSYTFYVRAINAVGNGPEGSTSAVASGTPSAPTGVTVVRQSGNSYPFAVNISWNRPSNTGGACIKAYRIEYSTDGSSVTSSDTGTTAPSGSCTGEPALSRAWTGLTAGASTRYFRVVATNTANLSATSGWASIALTQRCTLIATEDAYVNEGSKNSNYGSNANLKVSRYGLWIDDRAEVYVKFDPRSSGSSCGEFGAPLPGSAGVVSGNVRMFNHDPTDNNRDHQITRATGGWTEGAITWNNKPGYTNHTATQSGADSGWRTWAVDATDVHNQRTETTRFGWHIMDNGGNIFSYTANYRSRHGANPPELVITFY